MKVNSQPVDRACKIRHRVSRPQAVVLIILLQGALAATPKGTRATLLSHECGIDILYVDTAATGANDGSEWQNAYTTLDAALNHANACAGAVQEIWIAQGTYVPSDRTDPADSRSATFTIATSVVLRGAFAGSKSASPDIQDQISHPTTLSGDISSDDGPLSEKNDDNAYHVVSSTAPVLSLDRITIVGGNATDIVQRGGGILFQGNMLDVTECVFRNNAAGYDFFSATPASLLTYCYTGIGGGAIYAHGAERVQIASSTFEHNAAASGGAIVGNNLHIISSLFRENQAGCGGAIVANNAASLLGCEFDSNVSEFYGGAIDAVVESIEIADCDFRSNLAQWNAGAVNLFRAKRVSISGSNFNSNSAEEGGAIYLELNDELKVTQSAFVENAATTRGGAIIYRSYDKKGHWCLSDTSFTSNAAEEGGAVYSEAPVTVTDCDFISNWASSEGGAMLSQQASIRSCFFYTNGAATGGALVVEFGSFIDESLFRNNRAAVGGAAVLAQSTVDQCHFIDNRADVGGALLARGETDILNSAFWANLATYYGGAISVGGGNVRIGSSTMGSNRAGSLGGGVFALEGTSVENSILWGNRVGLVVDELAQIEGIAPLALSYNIIQGWTGVLGGKENSGVDPLFVNGNDPDGFGPLIAKLHLLPDSLAIDSGDPDFIAEPGEADLDGKPRVLCGRVDRGAYEFGVVGDMDCDRALTLADFAEWTGCETGPGEPQPLGDCQGLDAQVDGVVDLHDFAKLQVAIEPSSK